MPLAQHRITPADLLPDAEFAQVRKTRRAELQPAKRLRRIALGPWCTFYFESYETMLFQVQEMLLVEKGGAAQVPDELAAYNPLVPNGAELVATVMFEIDDPVRRETALGQLGGAEDCFFLQVGDTKVMGGLSWMLQFTAGCAAVNLGCQFGRQPDHTLSGRAGPPACRAPVGDLAKVRRRFARSPCRQWRLERRGWPSHDDDSMQELAVGQSLQAATTVGQFPVPPVINNLSLAEQSHLLHQGLHNGSISPR